MISKKFLTIFSAIFVWTPLVCHVPCACGAETAGKVVTYPAPAGEGGGGDFEIIAGRQKVETYSARVLDPPFAGKKENYGGNYAFANFDMAGRVAVLIRCRRPLKDVVIRPQTPPVAHRLVDENTIELTLDGPRKLSIEPNGKEAPLLLFANPLEEGAPKPKDPGVIYYGPGVHRPGRINLAGGQTLYLAGGAVVKAEVAAQGDNIRIRGRGILDGSDWEWRRGPVGNLISIRNCTNFEVSGITLRGSAHWTVVPRGSRGVTIRNVKLCNSRVQNDDGINPCNSQDVMIDDCFIRSDDDCVALKGIELTGPNNNTENITVQNSILWCDRARIFLLGHESRSAFMRKITLRNLDIIHFTMTPFLFEPGEEMRLEDVTVENLRLHGEGQRSLIRLHPTVNQYMRNKVPGHIRNVRFKDVSVEGRPGNYLVQVEGADDAHRVEQASFENVTILGGKLGEKSPQLQLGKNAEAVFK